MSKKLTDALRDAVIAKVQTGWSYQRCADWLKRSHTVSITPQSLHELVKRHRSALADVSKGVARSEAVHTVAAAIRSLRRRHTEATKIVRKAEHLANRDPLRGIDLHARAVTSWVKVHEQLQKASGLDQPDDPMLDGLAGLLGLAVEAREAAAEKEFEAAVTNGNIDPPPTH